MVSLASVKFSLIFVSAFIGMVCIAFLAYVIIFAKNGHNSDKELEEANK